MGGARGWDAPGTPWRRRRWRRGRLRADEVAPRRGEPDEPGRRAEAAAAAAQAQRRPQPEPERRAPTMAAQGEPGYLAAQSDPGSNSERSTDSPLPGSEDDLVAGAPLHSPEWSEERFRVDRKKLEAMLQGGHPPRVLGLPVCAPQLLPGHPRCAPPRPPLGPTADYVPGSPSPRSLGTPREWRSSGTLHPPTPLRSLGTGNPVLTCRLQRSLRPG